MPDEQAMKEMRHLRAGAAFLHWSRFAGKMERRGAWRTQHYAITQSVMSTAWSVTSTRGFSSGPAVCGNMIWDEKRRRPGPGKTDGEGLPPFR
jgi:hypothetical protein